MEWCLWQVSGRRQARGTDLVSMYLTSLDVTVKQQLVTKSQTEPDTVSQLSPRSGVFPFPSIHNIHFVCYAVFTSSVKNLCR